MSSYLTIKLNSVIISCTCRSSKLYTYCESAPWENYEEITLDKLISAISISNNDLKSITKAMDDVLWEANIVIDPDRVHDLREALTYLEAEKLECETARSFLLILKDITEMNTIDADTVYDTDIDEKPEFNLVWRKD